MGYLIKARWSPLRTVCLSALVSILISSQSAFSEVSKLGPEISAPPTETNGLSAIVVAQGIGPETGSGVSLQTPRWWSFLSMRMNLLSNTISGQANSYVWWYDLGVDFQLAARVFKSTSVTPYMLVGLSRMIGDPAGIYTNPNWITSWGYRFGIESRFEVTPFWAKETVTNIFFLEAGPQTSNLQRFTGDKVNEGFLVKVGFGRVF